MLHICYIYVIYICIYIYIYSANHKITQQEGFPIRKKSKLIHATAETKMSAL